MIAPDWVPHQVTSSWMGLRFSVYDGGLRTDPAKKANFPFPVREELATVAYASNLLQSRPHEISMTVRDTAVLEALLAHGWCARTARDKRGASALHYAAGHGHVECCALLCAAGLEVDDRAHDGATPLHWAVAGITSRGNARDRAHDGAPRDGARDGARQWRDGAGPHGFGTGGHVGMVKWLVGRGADVGAQTVDGNSILHWGAWAGTLEVLMWLTDHIRQLRRESAGCMHGGGVCTTSDGSSSLSGASPSKIGKGTSDSLSVHALNRNGCSAAHWAASGGGLAVCQWLAEELELDFSLPNLEGNTPLTKAIEHGREEIVRGSPLMATDCH